jgi:hypothetical protein
MIKPINFEQYEADFLAKGFDEVLARDWSPNQVVPTHIHEFDANALVVKGEMWLTVGHDTRHLLTGDTFELTHGTPHSEKYGPDGATFWVARINH